MQPATLDHSRRLLGTGEGYQTRIFVKRHYQYPYYRVKLPWTLLYNLKNVRDLFMAENFVCISLIIMPISLYLKF